MRSIRKRLVTDEQLHPVAVQIDYADRLEIERALLVPAERLNDDLSRHYGVLSLSLSLSEDPVTFQDRIRSEWP